MTDRKFTPPTSFPAEYVDGYGKKIVVLGRGPNKKYPLVGYGYQGYPYCWTEHGREYPERESSTDLHDIPKRIKTWLNIDPDAALAELYVTRKSADFFASNRRLCVYRIERDEDGGNPEIFVEEAND